MAKSIPTIEIIGSAGKVVINDTPQDRELYHKKGYTLADEDKSPLVVAEEPEAESTSEEEATGEGSAPEATGDEGAGGEGQQPSSDAAPEGGVRV